MLLRERETNWPAESSNPLNNLSPSPAIEWNLIKRSREIRKEIQAANCVLRTVPYCHWCMRRLVLVGAPHCPLSQMFHI